VYHRTHWTVEKITKRLELILPLVHRRHAYLPPFQMQELPDPMTPPPVGNVDRRDWKTIEPNSHWGRRYMDFILHTTFQVPADWEADRAVALYLPLGEAGDFSHPEALAFIDGAAYGTCDRHHQEFLLPPAARDNQPHQLDLHGWTGRIETQGFAFDPGLFMRDCAVVQIDQPTRDFVAAARVALETATRLDDNEPAKGHILNALDDAFKVLDTREPMGESFYGSVPAAHAALRAGIAKAGPALDVEVVGTGHAHIDVAWLWTLGTTRRKAGRTFTTVQRLMEQFPEYHFTQSQPQLYDYVRQDYPELFEAIKERVAEGRWEPIGGMWVEADCNLSGPESLARQFLLGRNFFRKHFGEGKDTRVLWLPDVFGYAWNLPQLIREAGLEYFFTIKIGWSQYNRLPYDSFWWQGLDGTNVLTHFSTTPDFGAFASTYNAMATPAQNLGTWQNFQQKELQQNLLMAFGYGDGGGGPTREMLENIREMNDFPGLPRMRNGSVAEFYDTMKAEAGDRLPTWNGELYLELHRGTYTTQSRNKRANRKSEFLLHDAEFLATAASLANPDYVYPVEVINKAWELVCLNQFHDIIPGSSIGPVYVESQAQYAEVATMAEEVLAGASAALSTGAGSLLIANPTSYSRSDLVFYAGELPEGKVPASREGKPLAVQPTEGGVWIEPGDIPAYTIATLSLSPSAGGTPNPSGALAVTANLLENDYLRVELNGAGDITRIYDKVNERDVLVEGAIGGQFQAHEDRPVNWDAWDVDIFLTDKTFLADPAESVRVVEEGPLRATLEIKRRILNSPYTQRVSLTHNSPRLDFETDIMWNERHIMLKVAFPVDVFSPAATYEIQWGNTERPTHRNSSWDWARFETCAQKWVDLSEGGYGVSVLNDCKYGHDILDNVIRISLLRSPSDPDPLADAGPHRFAYSLLPHAGRWNEETVAQAYALNDPLIIRYQEADSTLLPATTEDGTAAAQGPYPPSLVACDAPNIVIETIKRAEDGNGVIVRFYECRRIRGTVNLAFGFPVKAAYRTNLLEENQSDLTVEDGVVKYNVRSYEIVTVRVV
jgi:alpha-mannosidase